MKNKKLQLKDLSVSSFVTSLSHDIKETVKGGVQTQQLPQCDPNQTNADQCGPSGFNTCGGPCTTSCNSGLRTCSAGDIIRIDQTAGRNCDADGNATLGCTVVC
ncbi:MAG: pinensin family lanthipeptide [Bacteroidota bacterium]